MKIILYYSFTVKREQVDDATECKPENIGNDIDKTNEEIEADEQKKNGEKINDLIYVFVGIAII